jgi:hypothetical protein
MQMSQRFFIAFVVATAVGLAAQAKAPAPEPKPEEKSKTDPAGAPLEAKLVVKKDTYTLDLGGKTPEQYRDAVKASPPKVDVDLVLELKNTSDKEIKIWIVGDLRDEKSQAGGDYVTLDLVLQGPGALNVPGHEIVKTPATPPPTVHTLAAGKTWSLPLTSLCHGTHGVALRRANRSCWTESGEYTLTATFKTAVSPKPDGAKETKWANFEGGYVTVTTPAVKLKVVEKGKD